jgi:hypothetical protein
MAKGKARVGLLVRESLGGNKSSNRSADLQQLSERYETFSKRIKSFIQALQHQKAAMQQMDKARGMVRTDAYGDVRQNRPEFEFFDGASTR